MSAVLVLPAAAASVATEPLASMLASCLNLVGHNQLVAHIGIGEREAAFQANFSINSRPSQSVPWSGVLNLAGLKWVLAPNWDQYRRYCDGTSRDVAMMETSARLQSVAQNLDDDGACWQAFSIANVK